MTITSDIKRIEDAKAGIADVLTSKGVEVSGKIDNYASLIAQLPDAPVQNLYGVFTYYGKNDISAVGDIIYEDHSTWEQIHVPIPDGNKIMKPILAALDDGVYGNPFHGEFGYDGDTKLGYINISTGCRLAYQWGSWRSTFGEFSGEWTSEELGISGVIPEQDGLEIWFRLSGLTGVNPKTYVCQSQADFDAIMTPLTNPYTVITTAGGTQFIRGAIEGVDIGENITTFRSGAFDGSTMFRWIGHSERITSFGADLQTLAMFDNKNKKLNLTGLTTIPNNFLRFCPKFNAMIEFSDSLTSIGNFFLSQHDDDWSNNYSMLTTEFAQKLTIPASVTTIGPNFLYNTRVSEIVWETTAIPSKGGDQPISGRISEGYGNVTVYGSKRAELISGLGSGQSYNGKVRRILTNGGE